jgi:hypothetical protein
MSYATVTCPNEACEADIDVEGDVAFGHDDHPYGSTTAREYHTEVEVYGPLNCPECGAALDEEEIADEMIEAAL